MMIKKKRKTLKYLDLPFESCKQKKLDYTGPSRRGECSCNHSRGLDAAGWCSQRSTMLSITLS